jgi:mRNA interferase MazF
VPTPGDERPVLDPQTLRRGDLITVAGGFGEFGSKPRPAILLQSPALFGATVPVPICPITSVEVEAPLLRIPLAGGASGLEVPSWAAIDLMQTIRQRRIGRCIGRVDNAKMLEISQALLVFLGIGETAQ